MVLIIDRKKEIRYCVLCKKNYDHKEYRPECLIPCGHTFCHECMNTKIKKNCPKCSLLFNQIIIDYEMMDIVDVSLNLDDKETIPKSQSDNNVVEIINQESNDKNVDSITHPNVIINYLNLN